MRNFGLMETTHPSCSKTQRQSSKTLFHAKEIRDFAILEELKLLFSITSTIGRIEVIDLRTFRHVKKITSTNTEEAPSRIANRIEIHASSGSVCCLQCQGLMQATIYVWNFKKNIMMILPFEYISSAICLTLFHNYLFTGGSSSRVRIWELPSCELVDQISFNPNSISFTQLKASETRNILYCLEQVSNKVWIVDLTTKKLLLTVGLPGTFSFLEVLATGNIVTVSNQGNCIKFWETGQIGTGKLEMKVDFFAKIDAYGNFLIAEEDGKACVWIEKCVKGVKVCERHSAEPIENVAIRWTTKNFYSLPIRWMKKDRIVVVHTGKNIRVVRLQFPSIEKKERDSLQDET